VNEVNKSDINKIKNLEKFKESDKEYRMKNNERINEYRHISKTKTKDYRINNLDKLKVIRKEYKIKNKDKLRVIRMKKKREKNPNFVPSYSWKSREESKMNFDSIASLLHITDLSDWYRISLDQLKDFGGIVISYCYVLSISFVLLCNSICHVLSNIDRWKYKS
jgi:hypothetical protein